MRSGSSSRFWRAATSHRSQAWPAQCRQVQKLRKRHPFPRRDLIGMNVERSASQSYRPVALDGGKRHLRVEGRCVVPARSSVHGLSVESVFSAFRQKCHLSEPALYTCVWPDCFHPAAVFGKRTPRRQSGMVVVLIFGNSPQSKWRILIRSMIGSNSSKGAAALRQSSGAPTWGAWTIGAVEWMSGAQGVVAAQNPDSPRLLELGTFFISG